MKWTEQTKLTELKKIANREIIICPSKLETVQLQKKDCTRKNKQDNNPAKRIGFPKRRLTSSKKSIRLPTFSVSIFPGTYGKLELIPCKISSIQIQK